MLREVLTFGITFSLLTLGTALGATYYIPDDFSKIQDAISDPLVGNGDIIIVRPGTYTENIDFLGKEIMLKSEMGPDVTVIDGNRAGTVVEFGTNEGALSVIEGFTITNGKAHGGGGIHCFKSSPTIRNNIICGNSAEKFGGGIYCYESSPVIFENTITGNRVDNSVYTDGGGINCRYKSNPPIVNNIITRNMADGYGGGIFCDKSSPPIINNAIAGNSAVFGGGICCEDEASPVISNNTIFKNTAEIQGGGICFYESDVKVVNAILWNNQAPKGPELTLSARSTADISYSDLEGGQSSVHLYTGSTLNWGVGMIDADPQFVVPSTPAYPDFHLTYTSPCKDTGDSTSIPLWCLFDFEGNPRTAGGTVDMGADEFYVQLYKLGDVMPGNPVSIRIIGEAGMPVTMALGSSVQDPPQPTPFGDLFLTMPPLKTWNLGTIPPDGVLIAPTTIPSWWNPGDEKPFQALVGSFGVPPYAIFTNLSVLKVK